MSTSKYEMQIAEEMRNRVRHLGKASKVVFSESIEQEPDWYGRGKQQSIHIQGPDYEFRGTLGRFKNEPWVYVTESCDPGEEMRWTAAELRQIADKLDALNKGE